MSEPEQGHDRFEQYRGRGIRGLAENIASLGVLQATNYLLPLITLPYLVRVLGVEKFGLVAFAQGLIQFFIVFTDFGFNLSATREIASHRKDPEKVARIVWSVLSVRFLLLVAGFIVLGALMEVNRGAETTWKSTVSKVTNPFSDGSFTRTSPDSAVDPVPMKLESK